MDNIYTHPSIILIRHSNVDKAHVLLQVGHDTSIESNIRPTIQKYTNKLTEKLKRCKVGLNLPRGHDLTI